jgi:hypothetical protein
VVQVEKFLRRYETLAAEIGEDAIREKWEPEEREIAEEFLSHARAIRAERSKAAAEARPARLAELLQRWGGVTIAYRRRLIDSPSTPEPRGGREGPRRGIVFMRACPARRRATTTAR